MWQSVWWVVAFISLVSSAVQGYNEGEEDRLRLQLTDFKTAELEFRSLKPLPVQTCKVAWQVGETGRVSGHYQPLQGCATSTMPIHGGALHIRKCPVKREQWPFEEMASAEPNLPSRLHVCCSDGAGGGWSSLGFGPFDDGWCRAVNSTSPPPRMLEPVRRHLEQRCSVKTPTGTPSPRQPINVLVVGEMDTGKSTLVSFLKSGCRADERPVKQGMCAGGKSCTTLVRTFTCQPPSSSSEPPLFRVTDLWGIDWNTPHETLMPGVAPNHLGLLLDGKIRDSFDKNSTWGRAHEWGFFLRQLIRPDVHTRTPHIVSFQVDAVPLLNFNDDSKLQKLAELKEAFDFQARGIEVVVSVSRVDKALRDKEITFPHGQMDSCKVTSHAKVMAMKKRIAHVFNLQPSSVFLWQPYIDEDTRSLHHERHLADNLLKWMDLAAANAPHRPFSPWALYARIQLPLLLGFVALNLLFLLAMLRLYARGTRTRGARPAVPTAVPVLEGERHNGGTGANVVQGPIPPAATFPLPAASRAESSESEGEEGGVTMQVRFSSITDISPTNTHAFNNPLHDG